MNYTTVILDDYLTVWYNLILAPIIGYQYEEYNTYFDIYEDDIFKTVYPHEGSQINFQVCKIPQVFPFSAYIIPVIIQIIISVTVIWFLYIIITQLCRKKKKTWGKMNSYCMLRLKFMLSFVLFILLCLSATAVYKMGFTLDLAIRQYIQTQSDVVNNVRNEKTKFELQLCNVNTSVINTLITVENMINALPENIYDETYELVRNELNSGTKNFNNIMAKSDFLFEQSGLRITHNEVEQILEKEMGITEKLMHMFNNNIKIIISNITNNDTNLDERNKEIALQDIYKIKSYTDNFRGKYKFINWTNVYNTLQKTYKEVLPEINTSLNFINRYPSKIRSYIEPNMNNIKNVIERFRNEIEYIITKLRDIIKQIFHSKAASKLNKIIQFSSNTENVVNRNTTLGCKYLYFSTVLFLVPFFHDLFYIICMVQCVTVALLQVYFNLKRKKPISEIPCFKLVTEVGLMLLWTGLLLSIFCYLGALALSAVCRPLHTQRLYTQYIDNQREWNNKTWLDSVMNPWDHNYKMKNILEKCSDNVTVYHAFDVEKYWKLSTEFKTYKINIDKKEWIKLVENAVNDIELPNGRNCIEARDNFNFIEKQLGHCSSHIMDDVELFQNKSFKNLLQNITQKYSATIHDHKLSENLDILSYIENQNLPYIFNNFMEFKYLLKSNQNYLNTIDKAQKEMANKIKENMKPFIENEIKKTEILTNAIMENLEKNLSYRIKYEIGNCQYYSYAMKVTHINICGDLPMILNMAWIIFTLNALIMFISIIINRSLESDVSKIRQERRRLYKKEAQERILKQRQRLMDGTLLFDRRGQLLGNSRTQLNTQQ